MDAERENCAANTDRELWREGDGDGNGMSYYADSIHVTEQGAIGINCGGHVYVKPVREWHALAVQVETLREALRELLSAAEAVAWEAEWEAETGAVTDRSLALLLDALDRFSDVGTEAGT